jgi:membrane associated rhomboid family serine protease
MLRRLYARTPVITYALLALNIVIFAADFLIEQERGPILGFLGALWPSRVLRGEWWRLATSAWLHASLTHIAFNSIALYKQGRFVEPLLGRGRFLFVYLLSGLLASVAIVAITAAGITADGRYVGASACIMGIIGAGIFFLWRARLDLGLDTGDELKSSLVWLGVQFAIDGFSNSSFLAHFFGAVFGALVGAPFIMLLVRAIKRERAAMPQFGFSGPEDRAIRG